MTAATPNARKIRAGLAEMAPADVGSEELVGRPTLLPPEARTIVATPGSVRTIDQKPSEVSRSPKKFARNPGVRAEAMATATLVTFGASRPHVVEEQAPAGGRRRSGVRHEASGSDRQAARPPWPGCRAAGDVHRAAAKHDSGHEYGGRRSKSWRGVRVGCRVRWLAGLVPDFVVATCTSRDSEVDQLVASGQCQTDDRDDAGRPGSVGSETVAPRRRASAGMLGASWSRVEAGPPCWARVSVPAC